MSKRLFALLLLVLLVSVNGVSAQDGGSTLQAWADTPNTAINLTPQMTTPIFGREVSAINTYTATGDPVLSCASGGHAYSMWTSFVAPQTGTITVEALTTNYDSVIGVFKTAATNEFRCANAFASTAAEEVSFKMVAGTRYYILFAAAGAGPTVDSSSALQLTISTNAYSDQAFQIPASGSYSIIQTEIENATPGAPGFGTCGTAARVVFYRFKPAVTGQYEISTNGSSYDTVLGLAEGNTVLACNDNINAGTVNSRLRPTLTAGHIYIIGIGQAAIAYNPPGHDLVLSLRVRKL